MQGTDTVIRAECGQGFILPFLPSCSFSVIKAGLSFSMFAFLLAGHQLLYVQALQPRLEKNLRTLPFWFG